MGGEAKKLPRIDFSEVDPSAPGGQAWGTARGEVMDALATFGCFEAHYPALTPRLRAELFDGAVRPLFALPADAKRRNCYGADRPFHGYLGDVPGFPGYESLAIVDGTNHQGRVRPRLRPPHVARRRRQQRQFLVSIREPRPFSQIFLLFFAGMDKRSRLWFDPVLCCGGAAVLSLRRRSGSSSWRRPCGGW